MFIVGDGHLAIIGGNPLCPILVFIGASQEDHSGLKSLSSWWAWVGRLRVVHKWSCEQLDMSLYVLCPWWMKGQIERRLENWDLVARWTWSIDRGRSCRLGVEGSGLYKVRPRELRYFTTAKWSEYRVLYLVLVDVCGPLSLYGSPRLL